MMSVIGDDNFTNITKKQLDCENGIIPPEDKYISNKFFNSSIDVVNMYS